MKTNLTAIAAAFNFRKLFAKKGYAYFTLKDYNLNIIGIRRQGTKVTNSFDDVLVLEYKDGNGTWVKRVYPITTDPGLNFMGKTPSTCKGTAILVTGQYRGCWTLGKHKGSYTALVQCKPVKVYRDNDRDNEYDFNPEIIDEGIFGINIHKAGENSILVNNWSAGCQVFKIKKDFDNFIATCKKQVNAGLGDKFTYTLLDEEDLFN